MNSQEAIRIMTEFKDFCDPEKNVKDAEAFDMAIDALEQQEREKWHPLADGDFPDNDRLALVSFDNMDGIDIARFRTDEAGGMFCPGDEDYSYKSKGAFVNAWKECPERYDGGET